MRTYIEDGQIIVVLSERNLRTGLHKLVMPDSAREITSTDVVGQQGITLSLRFETDEEHYSHSDRGAPGAAGKMHPDTEAVINGNVPL